MILKKNIIFSLFALEFGLTLIDKKIPPTIKK